MSDPNAFVNPSEAAKRLGNRSRPASRGTGSEQTGGGPRRSPSLISSHEDAAVFEQISQVTSVKVKKQETKNNANAIDNFVGGAFNFMTSFSPAEDAAAAASSESAVSNTSTLDLRNNDNSFHVLASLLVEFFQGKVVGSTMLLMPQDRATVERLLPESARLPFVEALRYRLERCPAEPATPLQFLTLQCQELGLDIEGSKNPVMAVMSLDKDPVTLNVLDLVSERKQEDEEPKDEPAAETAPADEEEYVMDMKTSSSDEEFNDHAAEEEGEPNAASEREEPLSSSAVDDTALNVLSSETEGDVVSVAEGTPAASEHEVPLSPTATDAAFNVLYSEDRRDVSVAERTPAASDHEVPLSPAATDAAFNVLYTEDKRDVSVAERTPAASDHEVPLSPAATDAALNILSSETEGDASAAAARALSPTSEGVVKATPTEPKADDTSSKASADVLNALSFGTQQKTTVLTEEGKNTQEENLIELDESGSKMEGQSEQEALVEIKSEETASGIIADKPSVDPSIEQQPSTAGQVSPQSVASETRQVPHVASDEPSERFRAKMSSTADDGTYLLAKQQLQAELREASNLMAQSITPETTNFWRDHVLDLQARLRALHEQESRSVGLSRSPKPQTPTDILENNRRLVSEFQQREHYVPPVSLSQSRDTPKLELPTPQNIRTPTPQPMPQQMMQRDVVEPEGDYEMPMVDVVAPADLPAGYNFEAEIEGQRFLATVPPGGVRQGETFTCYMRELNSVSIDIPVGYWKDDLSNVCKYGWCHGVVCNTIFFPLITLGQIQTRINLDFLGRERFGSEARSNRFMMVTVIAFWIATNIALFAACNWKWSRGMELSFADGAAICLINLSMYAFTVFVTQATRSSLREKFMIREERCFDLEDLVCSAACLPCTICQMARHTANYDDYEAVCCSKTGLPDGVRVNQAPVKETDGYIV